MTKSAAQVSVRYCNCFCILIRKSQRKFSTGFNLVATVVLFVPRNQTIWKLHFTSSLNG